MKGSRAVKMVLGFILVGTAIYYGSFLVSLSGWIVIGIGISVGRSLGLPLLRTEEEALFISARHGNVPSSSTMVELDMCLVNGLEHTSRSSVCGTETRW